jgi:D-sedoheptulose 7-phosphate isomerase
MNPIQQYLANLQQTLEYLPLADIEAVIALLHQARLEGRKVFVMGNGGSASTASHLACDLSKNLRRADWADFRVLSLTDNMALFSAYANDEGYENVFVQQLANFVEPGDIVIGISTSGNSPNVVRAIELANRVGARTVGLTAFDGGELGQLVEFEIRVATCCVEQAEDVHVVLEHLITTVLRQHMQATAPVQHTVPQPVSFGDNGTKKL